MKTTDSENINSIQKKAETIRDVIRYIEKFKNATVVIYIDDRIIGSQDFSPLIRDISIIKKAGLKVILVPGAHRQIDTILTENYISWTENSGIRITSPDSMTLIKSAAFEVANNVMTSLAGERLTAVIGNWVRSRAKGVINGIDFGTAGEIDKIDEETINKILDDGFIPIFPCIGWSLNGKPYNISSVELASQIAVHLKADKLFFLIPEAEISEKNFFIPEKFGLSPEGNVPAMTIEETEKFLAHNKKSGEKSAVKNKILSILEFAKNACASGVSRAHIIDGSVSGSLPCEIFSDLGSGTMIYESNYGKIRAMRREDVVQVVTLLQPFVEKGILLFRSEKQLETTYNDFIVYEIDGAIRACAALHIYDRNQAEIAAVAVDETYSHIGIGPKLIDYLISKAKTVSIKSVFILTTQTSDWFENLGFVSDEISSLPEQRQKQWNPKRGSKVFRLTLNKN